MESYNTFKVLIILFCALYAASCGKKERLEAISANSLQAKIKVNEKYHTGSWTISPRINPDIFHFLDVQKRFYKFRNEPIVSAMDSLLKKRQYINLKANACVYKFNAQGHLIKDPTYDRMTGASNPLDFYKNMLEDFSQKTDFRQLQKSIIIM